MNWLAHLFLSDPTAECRMGNLLPDFLRHTALQSLPPEFNRGIRQHRIIDAFTDSHPMVWRSRRRLPPFYRRYGGIIVDMFYDHLLAVEWHRYTAVPLERFTEEVYASLGACCARVPSPARERLEQMIREDWIGSYRKTEGIQHALQRIGSRLRRTVELGEAVAILDAERTLFTSDFTAFFPELQARLRAFDRQDETWELPPDKR